MEMAQHGQKRARAARRNSDEQQRGGEKLMETHLFLLTFAPPFHAAHIERISGRPTCLGLHWIALDCIGLLWMH